MAVSSGSNLLAEILNQPMIARTRRNHGLEHATIHVLTQHKYHKLIAGHSDANGFWILGDVPTEAVAAAVQEALRRLRAGETQLALHPNCGTNLITAGTLAGLAGAAAMLGVGKRGKDILERLPLAASLATLMLILAQPLGRRLQERVTTTAEMGSLEVVKIERTQNGQIVAHRVTTHSSL
jgi:hypothetical protein